MRIRRRTHKETQIDSTIKAEHERFAHLVVGDVMFTLERLQGMIDMEVLYASLWVERASWN